MNRTLPSVNTWLAPPEWNAYVSLSLWQLTTQLPGLVRSVFVPFILPLALQFAAARRAQFRLVSQVRIAYRESPLSEGTAGAVHAGDRLPWVEGVDNFKPLAVELL